MLFMPNITMFQ